MRGLILGSVVGLAQVVLATMALAQTADIAEAATESFAPGSYGEPFTLQALVQGCQDFEGMQGCVIYAEGWRWLTYEGSVTNPAILRLLGTLPVNTAVEISGDMVSQGDITVEAVFNRLVPIAPDAYAELRSLMQGGWVDATDPKNVLTVVGSEETTIYDGQAMDTAVLTYSDSCDGAPEGAGPVLMKQLMGGNPMDTPCFAIIDLSAERMELSHIGRGNTLVFTRQ